MLVLRAILFTILLPGTITIYIPSLLLRGSPPPSGALRFLGLLPIVAGALGYFTCALEFLLRGGGTPALFLARPLRFLIGEEPKVLIESALYRYLRNPMYVSVVTVVLGEALLFESGALLYYALTLWLFFHLVVVFVEEPHLRQRPGYTEYCARVPRWLLPSVRK
ncbi:MAG TPA: methyltransferase [Bryobacteraceae bacterium]|nr:methyltransferase [Bryobacteraceae bacterium]